MDFALNNLQRLICHKTQPTNQPTAHAAFLFSTVLFQAISPPHSNSCRLRKKVFILFAPATAYCSFPSVSGATAM